MTDKPKKPRKPHPGWRQPPLTVAKVKKALIANHGVQARAAEQLGVTRSTVCHFIKAHPPLRQLLDDMIPDVVDMAKENIVGHMASKDENVSLRASAKVIDIYGHRFGLGARQHFHSAPDGGPIQFDMSVFTDEQLAQLESIQATIAAAARSDPR